MTIRQVTPADAAEITAIHNHYVVNTTISFETEPITVDEMSLRIASLSAQFPYFIAEIDGKTAAYCYVHLWKERAAYAHTLETTIYVAPEYRRIGLGRKLMVHLIDECRKRGYKALIACITGGNEPSCRLHEALGFKQVSKFDQVGMKFGRMLDVVDYELLLDSFNP